MQREERVPVRVDSRCVSDRRGVKPERERTVMPSGTITDTLADLDAQCASPVRGEALIGRWLNRGKSSRSYSELLRATPCLVEFVLVGESLWHGPWQ